MGGFGIALLCDAFTGIRILYQLYSKQSSSVEINEGLLVEEGFEKNEI